MNTVRVVGFGNCGPVPVDIPEDQVLDTDLLWVDYYGPGDPSPTDEPPTPRVPWQPR